MKQPSSTKFPKRVKTYKPHELPKMAMVGMGLKSLLHRTRAPSMLPSIPGALEGHAHPWVYKPVLKNLVNLTETIIKYRRFRNNGTLSKGRLTHIFSYYIILKFV
jgi:hypothetical protein